MKRFEQYKDNKYVDTTTGEIVTYHQAKNILKQTKKEVTDLVDSELKQIKEENGVVDKKDTHKFNWNNTKGNPTLFVKNYKVFQREVSKHMNLNELGLMTLLTMNLETETNKVLVNGKSPSNKELCDMINISDKTLKNILSSLRKKKLIVTQGRGLGREIYVNPYWAFDGKNINRKTLNLFKLEQ